MINELTGWGGGRGQKEQVALLRSSLRIRKDFGQTPRLGWKD